ncbi:MAG: T9SS type A sorting domain-containing protein [Bacteroidota bacterium]
MKTKLLRSIIGVALFAFPFITQAQTEITTVYEDARVKDVSGTSSVEPWGNELMLGAHAEGTNFSAVIPFLLPDNEGKTVSSVSFESEVTLIHGGVPDDSSIDLYALGARDVATVLPEDFYMGAFNQDDTDAVAIQQGYLVKTTPVGKVSTTTDANTNLKAYIQAQYDAGNTNKYIFIRLSPSYQWAAYQRYYVFGHEGADADLSKIAKLTINFEGTNTIPVLNPIGDQTVKEGETLDVTVSATDADGDALTLTATNLPSFASFTDNNGGSGILSFAPLSGDAGTYSDIVVEVSDGTDTSSETISLTVTPAGDVSIAVDVDYYEHDDNGTIINIYRDNEVNTPGPKRTESTVGWVGADQVYIGGGINWQDAEDNYDMAAVFPFQIPEIPAGKKLKNVSFSGALTLINGTWGQLTIDMYAFVNENPEVLPGYSFGGAFGTDTNATGIQAGIIDNKTAVVGAIETNTDGNTALLNFMNTQYTAGKAGQYVFLRLNKNTADDIPDYLRVDIASSDNADSALHPKLVFTFEDNSTAAVENVEKGALGIYPNPVSNGRLKVSLDGFSTDASLQIYTVTGRMVHSSDIKATSNSIFETKIDLNPGLYIVKLNDGVRSKSQKLIVQ